MKSFIQKLIILFFASFIGFAFLSINVNCQSWLDVNSMKKIDRLKVAKVLQAISEDWALVDNSSDVDFLVCVNEDRDELNFYPKKEFVLEIERSGLIKNVNKESSSVRKSSISYEGDYLKREWKGITVADPIVYKYEITPEGKQFLRDTPKILGKPLPPMKVAENEVHVESKVLKVVIYDQQTIQKLVDAFVQKSKNLVEKTFSPKSEADFRDLSQNGMLLCGPKLWQIIKPQTPQNGTFSEMRIERHSYNGVGEVKTTLLDDRPISDIKSFWKSLQENKIIDDLIFIKRTQLSDATAYLDQIGIRDNDFPPPTLSSFAVAFKVESNKAKLVVVVKNEFKYDSVSNSENFEPAVKWVELIDGVENRQ